MYKNFPSLLHLAISFLNDFIMLLDLETARIEHQWGLHLRFRKLVLTTVVPESLKQYPQLVTTQLLFSCDIKILQISNYRHCFRDVWTKNVADISVNEDCPLQDFPGGPAVKNLPTTSGTQIWSLVQEDPTCCGQLSPCTTTTEPSLKSLWATTTEPEGPRAHSVQREATTNSPSTSARE